MNSLQEVENKRVALIKKFCINPIAREENWRWCFVHSRMEDESGNPQETDENEKTLFED